MLKKRTGKIALAVALALGAVAPAKAADLDALQTLATRLAAGVTLGANCGREDRTFVLEFMTLAVDDNATHAFVKQRLEAMMANIRRMEPAVACAKAESAWKTGVWK